MAQEFRNARAIADGLIPIVGMDGVRVDADSVLVAPSEAAQLAAVMRYANRSSFSVAPLGSGTKQGWGHPVDAAIQLQMDRFNAVKEHVWQDMTCTVEAGTSWSSMQSELRQHGQCVALDPLWPDKATVGGVVAVNDSGASRLKYGSLRDLIIGMTIVLADGTIAKSGGKVVKNVAGYDLHKLMTGAFGTLGVIADVTFRLHATTAHARSFTIRADRAEALGEILLQLAGSQLSLEALQMRTIAEGFCLDVCLATMPAVLSHQHVQLETMAAAHGLRVEEGDADLWRAREREIDRAIMGGFAIKAVMLPSAVAHFCSVVRKLSGTCVVQAGGIMTAFFTSDCADAVVELRNQLESLGGQLTILRQPASANVPIWGRAPDALPLMKQVKQKFDPNHILNPGRFLDGI